MIRKSADLNTEMLDLKKCQIDMMKMAFTMFAVISTLFSGLLNYHKTQSVVKPNATVDFELCCAMIVLLSIIPIIYPYMIWVIIHKCRSLFRITAYIRLLEECECDETNNASSSIIGYETLYITMREDKWFKTRVDENPINNFINKYRPYWWWRKKYASCSKVIDDRNLKYRGGFYTRVVKMMQLMTLPFIIAILYFSKSYYNVFSQDHSDQFYNLSGIFIIFPAYLVIYSIYHYNLAKRYNDEILGIPFSQDAQYEMWNRALEEKKKSLTTSSTRTRQTAPVR